MGFTITVGRDPDTVNDVNAFSTGQDAPHYLYIISKYTSAAIGVSLTDMEALVKMEVANTKYKFATFSISGANWSIENIEASWHTSGSTAKQLISVSAGSLGISTGNYVGIVFEVPANTSLNTFVYYEEGGSSLTNYYQISDTYVASGSAGSTSQPPLDIYGYGEYNHLNTDPIPHTSQSTGEVDRGDVYIGYGAIQLTDIQCTGTHKANFNLQTPWGSTYDTNILAVDESVTESRSIAGGTEYYKITVSWIDCTNGDVTFTEQWWSDVGKRYVKTTGSDSALGTAWEAAWKTVGYGFQNTPPGKDLYVEECLYGGETLSNFDPPQTMSMYIQPSGYIEAPCNVWVSDDTVFSDGNFSTGSVSNWITSGITIIDPFQTITAAGVVNAFSYYAANPGARNVKVKIFRDDGTNYNFIGESELFSFVGSSPGTLHDYNVCNIAVQVGDIIGIYLDGGYLAVNNVGANFLVSKSGDITSNSTKASWAISGAHRTPMRVGVRGFK